MDDTFTCARCGHTYPKAWSDAEAIAEGNRFMNDDHPVVGLDESDVVVICDDCYHTLLVWYAKNRPPEGGRR